jgi:hypothetical protein
MAPRKRPAAPVEIVLSEEDLAAIIRETVAGLAAGGGAVPAPAPAPPAPAPPPDRAWSLGVRSPGAVGDAIRMILDATTLDRGKRMKIPGGGE